MLHAPTTENKAGENATKTTRSKSPYNPLPARELAPRASGRMTGGSNPVMPLRPSQAPVLQRKCACGGDVGPTGECAACRAKRLQRKASTGTGSAATAPPIVHDVLRSGGQPLDVGTRAYMEPRFGRDFSGVRVHNGGRAAESARAVNAHAYTVGQNVVFGAGTYQPSSAEGKRLLAHELTHVVQQSSAASSAGSSLTIAAANSASEAEADVAAQSISQGRAVSPIQATAPSLARDEAPESPAPANQAPANPAQAAPANAPAPDKLCSISDCSTTAKVIIDNDIFRSIQYVNRTIAALNASPLTGDTRHALNWYFNDDSDSTIATVRTRLGCILDCLQDTRKNNRYGCRPTSEDLAATYVEGTPLCTQVFTNICYSVPHFGTSERERAQTTIHECAHRVGMSLGSPKSVEDIYSDMTEFAFLSTEDALRTSESYAIFAGAISEGIQLRSTRVFSAAGGVAFSPGTRSSATWYARLYVGKEFQRPVLGIFNPTLGIGMSIIGNPAVSGTTTSNDSQTILFSLLPGIRLGNPRGPGGFNLSLFGGPAIDTGGTLGAEAGVAVGYRWSKVSVSAGVGYDYDPAREAGLRNTVNASITATLFTFAP